MCLDELKQVILQGREIEDGAVRGLAVVAEIGDVDMKMFRQFLAHGHPVIGDAEQPVKDDQGRTYAVVMKVQFHRLRFINTFLLKKTLEDMSKILKNVPICITFFSKLFRHRIINDQNRFLSRHLQLNVIMEKNQREKRYIANIEISEEEEPPSKFSQPSSGCLSPERTHQNPAGRETCHQPILVRIPTDIFSRRHHQGLEQLALAGEEQRPVRCRTGRYIRLSDNEVGIMAKDAHTLPLRITPYYISLLDRNNPEQPLRKSVVPVFDEYIVSQGEASDPLSEEHDSPVPNIVHRYPDRVLFLSTGFCTTYCRYCTRTHMVAKDKCHIGIKAWEAGTAIHRRSSRGPRCPGLRRRPAHHARLAYRIPAVSGCAASTMSRSSASAPRSRWCCRSASPGRWWPC